MIQGRRSEFEGAPMWTKENRGRYDRSRLRYPSDLTDEEWALVEQRTALMDMMDETRHCLFDGSVALPTDTGQ
jgi:hypothetical protein